MAVRAHRSACARLSCSACTIARLACNDARASRATSGDNSPPALPDPCPSPAACCSPGAEAPLATGTAPPPSPVRITPSGTESERLRATAAAHVPVDAATVVEASSESGDKCSSASPGLPKAQRASAAYTCARCLRPVADGMQGRRFGCRRRRRHQQRQQQQQRQQPFASVSVHPWRHSCRTSIA